MWRIQYPRAWNTRISLTGRYLLGTTLAACLVSFYCVRSSFGQAVYGNIIGTVSDSSGAAVPNANVTIIDVEHGVSQETKTNAEGNYSQTHLLSGHYQVKISAPGFVEVMAPATVEVDATTQVNAQLQVGKTVTSVTITGETPLLKTDRAEVSATLTANQLEELPIFNRNITSLVLEMPGAQMNLSQHTANENPQGGFQINVNGQFFYSNGFELDGTENHGNTLGIAIINPNPDALQEFKVTTSNYDAEFGNVAGALLQAATKSGTNQVHGSAFDYLRNDVFNASNPFTGINPPIRWNQFGGTFGGAIKKDKAFGFFAYQGTRRRLGSSLVETVPTTAERNGDLTALLGDYICANGTASPTPCGNPVLVTTDEGATVPAQNGMVFDPSTGNPDGSGRKAVSTNGQVNVLSVAPAMQKLLEMLPQPNTGAAGQFASNYIASLNQQFNSDQYDGRVDYNVSDKLHFFSRYSMATFNMHSPGAYGEVIGGPTAFGFSGLSTARNQSLAMVLTYTVSPTLIADFRFGTYRYRIRSHQNGYGTSPVSDLGLPGVNIDQPTSGVPGFEINGDGGFNFGNSLSVNGCACPLQETENQFQWVNNWTKMSGNHTIKWGADIRRAQQTRVNPTTGDYGFANSTTGDLDVDTAAAGAAYTGQALASFLLGLPSTASRQFTGYGQISGRSGFFSFYPSVRQTRLFFFGQDAWRVTRKLTLSIGMRYENYTPQAASAPGGQGTFDPETGEVVVAGIGPVPRNMGIHPYNLGFAPRIGIAYQLQPRTVIRAGYGLANSAAGVGAVWGQGPELQAPVQPTESLNPANQYSSAVPNFLTSGLPAAPSQLIGANGRYPLPDGIAMWYWLDQLDAYRIPGAEFWNFTVQHSFQPTLTAEVAYVGNVGRHLFANENRNQAVPGPGDYNPRRPYYKFGLTQPLWDVANADNSDYNALQTKLEKRTAHGLSFLLTYTWSKAMTNGEGGYAFDNAYDLRADHGPSSWDHTHALTLMHTWQLPVGKGRRYASKTSRIADAVIGGWEFSGVTTMLSGQAFSPGVYSAPLLNTDFSGVRPDIIGNPHVENPSASLWFNPAAYTAPSQPYRDGTASKGSLRGPAQYTFNLALEKNFVISEGKTLEFRWENFNAFNHDNLGLPHSAIDGSDPGQIFYTATDMRQMQFGLHFRF